MSPVLALEKTIRKSEIQESFLAELVKQIRLSDTLGKYRNWSDELLMSELIISADKDSLYSKNLNFDPLNQLLTNAFYQAIGASIEKRTGYCTDTYVYIRNQEFSSAVISCGGVLVLYSLIWGYRSFGFLSLQELIKSAENYISDAVNKASHYLDF